MKTLARRLGDASEEEEYSPDQAAFVDATRKHISVALQRGNAQTIIHRARRDRFASSGRGIPPASHAEWGLGTY